MCMFGMVLTHSEWQAKYCSGEHLKMVHRFVLWGISLPICNENKLHSQWVGDIPSVCAWKGEGEGRK